MTTLYMVRFQSRSTGQTYDRGYATWTERNLKIHEAAPFAVAVKEWIASGEDE
jgi:hypothetical protein